MELQNYNHDANVHSEDGARNLIPFILEGLNVNSFLDLGAGTGVWIKAVREYGVHDVLGVDGVVLEPPSLRCEAGDIQYADLTKELFLGRSFDLVVCFEVAEHLPADSAASLVNSIVAHSDLCFFSAAAPGQNGENHINCQWPEYWQSLFNLVGFECSDEIRQRIWNVSAEPWYRQNMFMAFRSPNAGAEPVLRRVVHPEMLPYMATSENRRRLRRRIAGAFRHGIGLHRVKR